MGQARIQSSLASILNATTPNRKFGFPTKVRLNKWKSLIEKCRKYDVLSFCNGGVLKIEFYR